MEIIKPSNTTRILAESQDEFLNLPIVDVEMDGGSNVMLSMWRPSAEELQALNDGACVTLGVVGHQHPPVMVYVSGPAFEAKDDA